MKMVPQCEPRDMDANGTAELPRGQVFHTQIQMQGAIFALFIIKDLIMNAPTSYSAHFPPKPQEVL